MSIRQGNRIIANHTIVDEGLNSASANPVQNSAITGALNTKANDSDAVHKAGAETITGAKTFSSANTNYLLKLQNTSDTKSATPNSLMDTAISFTDANGANMARALLRHHSDGTTQFSIIPECSLSSANFATWFTFVNTGTRGYINAPSVNPASNSTSSVEVPTIGWVNNPSLSTNVVHRTGDETIAGPKTFDSNNIYHKLSYDWSPTSFSDNMYSEIRSLDSRGCQFGQVRAWMATDGTSSVDLLTTAERVAGSVVYGGAVGSRRSASGSCWGVAPASAVAGSIVITTAISKASNGYVKLGNGIIIQWGAATVSESGYNPNANTTVTLPTAFSNTSYKVMLSQIQQYAGERNIVLRTSDATTTTFVLYARGNQTTHWLAIGY